MSNDSLGTGRRFPRIPSSQPILAQRLDEAPDAIGGNAMSRTRTVGLGGCMFTSDESFGPGTILDLVIKARERVVRTTARVVWEATISGDRFEVGCEFLDLEDADRAALAALFRRTDHSAIAEDTG